MGSPERNRIDQILRSIDGSSERLFRINAGSGWIGRIAKRIGAGILLANARPLHAAPKGWPDLFGWKTITVTPDMVGRRLAVAKGIEVKVTGKLSAEQRRFGAILERMGGIFIVDTG